MTTDRRGRWKYIVFKAKNGMECRSLRGEVNGEECTAEETDRSRAVKMLWHSQLRRYKIDIRKEIGALAKLSYV